MFIKIKEHDRWCFVLEEVTEAKAHPNSRRWPVHHMPPSSHHFLGHRIIPAPASILSQLRNFQSSHPSGVSRSDQIAGTLNWHHIMLATRYGDDFLQLMLLLHLPIG